jgi:D-ribose pyranase
LKKGKLINDRVSAAVARMGHTQQIAIGDCGLPIPGNVERIDLAVTPGIPAFLDVLDAVLAELDVQKVYLATESKTACPEHLKKILERFGADVEIEYFPHEELKKSLEHTVAVIRTGECTSFSNIILESRVDFSG